MRGDLDKSMHRSQVLESRQDDLLSKLASQESRFERRIGDSEKRSIEDNKRLGWVEKQLVDQDALLKESATEAVPNLRPLRPVWIK